MGVSMNVSWGVAYFDTRMEGGSVRGRVSALRINITQQRTCRFLLLCVWAGSQPSLHDEQ